MTNENPNKYTTDPLWIRLSAFRFDEQEAIHPYSAKLADEEKWTRPFTREVIEEYRRFLYLCCISSTGASPSPKVDAAWHMHLTYTRSYWLALCRDTLYKDVHHHPSRGGGTQKDKYDTMYINTLQLYKSTFGTEPPAHIWDPPGNSVKARIKSRIEIPKHWPATYLPLLLPHLVTGLLFNHLNPFNLKGPQFLLYYFLLGVTASIVMWHTMRQRKKQLDIALTAVLPQTDKYDLAFLTGGRNYVVIQGFADLLERKLLIHKGGQYYETTTELQTDTKNPASKFLVAFEPGTLYSFRQMEMYFEKVAIDLWDKLGYLVSEYEATNTAGKVPIITFVIGGLRVVQGLNNERPITYLLGMLLCFLTAYMLFSQKNNFHKMARHVLNPEVVAQQVPESQYGPGVVCYGIDGLTGLLDWKELENVRAIIFPPQDGGDGSGTGGCSSGCGSGCGGGCGGCGGGD